MKKPIIDTPANEALFDVPINKFNAKIITPAIGVDWIDQAFGKIQRLTVRGERGKIQIFPAVLKGRGKDYINLLPREDYGNFIYWELDKEYDVEEMAGQKSIITSGYGLVVFMNLDKVLAPEEHRNLELIKEQMMEFIGKFKTPNFRMSIDKITEENGEIWKGYNLKEVEDQHLMAPFAAIKIKGKLRWERWC